ncbi:endonuclease-reverse transcriptase [Elysia marginata]|uniref:Endonuclease-reverse transcriptase n=1 Tax=Elysia marginata TaxID=1093978 RepID=A0AAV4FP97_9GAST|nr:endonuclease-reverse transcriptase [Elysia marginata]
MPAAFDTIDRKAEHKLRTIRFLPSIFTIDNKMDVASETKPFTSNLAYYGRIRRHQSLQKSIMEGKINGKRQRGRKRKSWLGNIEETTTRRINECCEVALNREEWRRTIASNLWQETEQR